MTLQELAQKYEDYLDTIVEIETISTPLYRGDRRDFATISAAGGFFPKAHAEEELSIDTLLSHCAINGYGGPFISTTENPNLAREYGTHVYRITQAVDVVSQKNWVQLKGFLAHLQQLYNQNRNSPDYLTLNRVSNYIQTLNAAVNYNDAQHERLVIENIPIGKLEIVSP